MVQCSRQLHNTVGLEVLKDFVLVRTKRPAIPYESSMSPTRLGYMFCVAGVFQDVIHDTVGRKGSGETGGFHYRHILLTGTEGSGKKTAASLIGNLTAVVQATKDSSQFMPPVPSHKVRASRSPPGQCGPMPPPPPAKWPLLTSARG